MRRRDCNLPLKKAILISCIRMLSYKTFSNFVRASPIRITPMDQRAISAFPRPCIITCIALSLISQYTLLFLLLGRNVKIFD
jgi:hypothetical protein